MSDHTLLPAASIDLPLLPLRDVVVFSTHGDSFICWAAQEYQGT